MRLSKLQKTILLHCLDAHGRLRKNDIDAWYAALSTERAIEGDSPIDRRMPVEFRDAQNTITRTLEHLIDKGCLVGHGVRTQQKWFIHEIRLTPFGRALAKKIRGIQQHLPLHSSS